MKLSLPEFIQLATATTSSSGGSGDAISTITGLLLILICIALYFLPFIIAAIRGHSYMWVIFGLNAVGFTGITWLGSFVWAVWPSEKSLIDPLAGNVTGTGRRNSGDTLGSVEYGKERGYESEKNSDA